MKCNKMQWNAIKCSAMQWNVMKWNETQPFCRQSSTKVSSIDIVCSIVISNRASFYEISNRASFYESKMILAWNDVLYTYICSMYKYIHICSIYIHILDEMMFRFVKWWNDVSFREMMKWCFVFRTKHHFINETSFTWVNILVSRE